MGNLDILNKHNFKFNKGFGQNFIFDKINMGPIDAYIKSKQEQGLTNFNLMHIIIASYVRTCSQRPAINRFIRGQKIYTRKKVEVAMVVKKEMGNILETGQFLLQKLPRP